MKTIVDGLHGDGKCDIHLDRRDPMGHDRLKAMTRR